MSNPTTTIETGAPILGWVVANDDYQDEIPAGRTAAIVLVDFDETVLPHGVENWWLVDYEGNIACVPSGSQVELPTFPEVTR